MRHNRTGGDYAVAVPVYQPDSKRAMRTDERLAAGDMEGEAVWLRIVKAIEELRQREPGDRAVH